MTSRWWHYSDASKSINVGRSCSLIHLSMIASCCSNPLKWSKSEAQLSCVVGFILKNMSIGTKNGIGGSPTPNTPTTLLQLSLPGVSTVARKSLWGLCFWRSCSKAAVKIMARWENVTCCIYCGDPTLLEAIIVLKCFVSDISIILR
jgi:hypothetical protein